MDETNRRQNASMWHEIEGLQHQTVGELKGKYREVFGQESRSNHKQFLVRRIAWRLQANAKGDLSERARHRALALAEEAELRTRAPASFLKELSGANHRDARLPPPGTWLTRQFQQQSVTVEVLDKGFGYQGRVYRSLSAVARHVTGTQWNGFLFFDRALRESAGSAQISGSDRKSGRGRGLVAGHDNMKIADIPVDRRNLVDRGHPDYAQNTLESPVHNARCAPGSRAGAEETTVGDCGTSASSPRSRQGSAEGRHGR